MGALRRGQAADLVLLQDDPLKDIRNTTKIVAVMAAGRWFDRPALDALLRNVEEGASSRCPEASVKEVQTQ